MNFTSDINVNLMNHIGSDSDVVRTMMVSTKGLDSINETENEGKINYLMKHRHGTPFEHNLFTFLVNAPLFVWREHHRHRIGFSYNEESGRYKKLEPNFWIPRTDRKIIPVPEPMNCPECKHSNILDKVDNGTKQCPRCGRKYIYHSSARPCFEATSKEVYDDLIKILKLSYTQSYEYYENMLKAGLAKEVCRAVLPVAIFSSCYVTCNLRSLMNFLSLRTHRNDAKYISYPQAEIEQVADQYEYFFKYYFPITHQCFQNNGRVAP